MISTEKPKFLLLDALHEGLQTLSHSSKDSKIKKADLKILLEQAFTQAAQAAAKGERVKFPVVGTLTSKETKARPASKGTNPFTGAPMVIKARPSSQKPKWTFPRSLKDIFSPETSA